MITKQSIFIAAISFLMGTTALAAVNGPVKSVTLSSGGLAEIVREAEVNKDAEITIEVPLDQVDDVLKSLIVRDDKGEVKNLSLAGPNPLEETFRTLPFKPDDLASMPKLLNSIKGTRVKAGDAEGVILGVTAVTEDKKSESWQLSILMDSGEMTMVPVPGSRIEILDADVKKKLATAMAVIAKGNADGARSVTVKMLGEKSRTVAISYVVPAPIWKTSYRLVSDGKDSVRLQAWAVFENASGEDWHDVAVTLSSGRPVTLKQQLHQHFWKERTEVPVNTASEAIPLAMQAEAGFSADAIAAPSSLPMPPAPRMAEKDVSEKLVMAGGNQANATEGDVTSQFSLDGTYDVKNGDTVSVPILDKGVKAEMVSLYRQDRGSKHPDAAAIIENNSGISLPTGILTVYDGKVGYVGDASIQGVPNGEEQSIRFAVDQKVSVAEEHQSDNQIVKVSVSDGVLRSQTIMQEITTYTVTGAKDGERTLVIEVPKRDGWAFTADNQVKGSSTDYRIKTKLAAGEEKQLKAKLEIVADESFSLVDADENMILAWQTAAADPATKAKLEELALARREQVDIQTELNALDEEYARVVEDQGRARENLQAVGEGDTQRRFDKLLNDLQTRLEDIEARRQSLRRSLDEARAKVGAVVRSF